MEKLALLGGSPSLNRKYDELFAWPIVTDEDEQAVLEVLRRGAMSGLDVTEAFEREFAAWQGRRYAIGYCNGTLSLQAAMFAVGVGEGDEIICPSKTYWASCLQAFNLGASVAFADIDPHSLCIDPKDIEGRINSRTRAIMVVHYLAHPADMDPIMEVARKYHLPVIEDVSHAQGGLYKGRKLGTIGDVAAMSLMSGKSFATGEMGMLVTDDPLIYQRAMAYAHYERNNPEYVPDETLSRYHSMPLGGVKGRVNQLSSAMGRVQLKYYDARCAQIRKAMNYFWDLLEGVPALEAHRVDEATGSNMAGWYAAHGIYHGEALGGLSVQRFCQAVKAEGVSTAPGGNYPLHTHPLFLDRNAKITGQAVRPVLPVSESVDLYAIPWFKHFDAPAIEAHAAAFRKVAEHFEELLPGDDPHARSPGRWFFYNDKE